jgi:WD40 repeat protein/tetratricopeptide (TPR) repeat protein
MSPITQLVSFGLRQVIGDYADSAVQITAVIEQRFRDHSTTLPKALNQAHHRAWQALGVALAGDGLLDRVKVFFASGDDKGVRQQVQLFLDGNAVSFDGTPADFRRDCLDELQRLRKSGRLSTPEGAHAAIARQAAGFQRHADPQGLVEEARRAVNSVADALAENYPNLARLLRTPTPAGPPLLAAAFCYFFRREVETNDELAHGLFFDGLRQLSASQAKAFGEVDQALASLGGQFDALFEQLGRIEAAVEETHTVAVETHGAVLDIQTELQRSHGEARILMEQVLLRLGQVGMARGEVRPGNSCSIRGEDERRAVKALLARYRKLPAEEQRQAPALLNGLGKLQVGAGDFTEARQTFTEVVAVVGNATDKAEASFNAYQASLAHGDLSAAFQELLQAIKLDGARFSPFPVRKYRPQRILGAGGFGVTFLCRHEQLQHNVVVKVLRGEGLARNMEELFDEARILNQLQHDCIVRVIDCAYARPKEKDRPYFVMEYFDGKTLQEYVQAQRLSENDCAAVAGLMADGLKAAHDKKIFHRDVKPANVLVRRDGSTWHVKLIDFGLALRADAQHETRKEPNTPNRPLAASEVAGTFDYAAPEQMGRRPGVTVGPYSDIYGLARTCCYAMFATPQPLRKHWESISGPLSRLLGECLEDDPAARPADCGTLIGRLRAVEQATPAGGTAGGLWWALAALQSAIIPGGAPPTVRIIGPPKPPPFAAPSGAASVVEAPWWAAAVEHAGDGAPSAAFEVVKASKEIKAHDGKVLFVTFAPAGGRLLSTGDDGAVRLWRPDGSEAGLYLRPPNGWFKPAAVVYAAFTSDGRRVFSVSTDGMVRLWNVNTSAEVRNFALRLGVTSAALSPDGRRLLVGGQRSVTLWDVEQGRLILQLGGGSGHLKADVQCVAFASHGGVLAGALDGVVHLYDGQTGEEQLRLEGHGGGVYAVAVHPNGRHTLTGAGDHGLHIWDVERGQGWSFAGHSGEVFGVAVSRDGRLALTGGADQTVFLWLLKGWRQIACLEGHTDQVRCVAFSPNGRQAASCGDDGTIRIWPVRG